MRLSENGKTVTLQISVWWNPKDRKIHLASSESKTLIATVNNDPDNRRGHPKLFRELAKILKEMGAQYPND